MSCAHAHCLSPRCKGATWSANDAEPSNVRAFLDDVAAYMRRTGRRDVGACMAAVFATAQKRGCVDVSDLV